jgi:cobalt-precorrin 5A hydrolase / precorrin-3B C17-methyltransferase
VIGLIAVTAAGQRAAERLAETWPGTRRYEGSASAALPRAFAECDAIVCFLAVGATVRLLAPLLGSKHTDPGVVCVDEALRYAVPVIGAHAGGGNDLARRAALVLGGEAVITTASDAAGSVALDEFGADLGFVLEPGSELAAVGAAVLSGERVTLAADGAWPLPPLPPNVVSGDPEPDVPAIIVSDRLGPFGPSGHTVVYRPPSLVVGIGASRGVPAAEVTALVDAALADASLSPRSVRQAATIDLKADEAGLLAAVRARDWPLAVFPAASLAMVPVPNPSEVVRAAAGTPSVAEAAALLAASGPRPAASGDLGAPGGLRVSADPAAPVRPGIPTELGSLNGLATPIDVSGLDGPVNHMDSDDPNTPGIPTDLGTPHGSGAPDGPELVVAKRASAHATVAVARARPRGRLAVVGIGPGARDLLTPRAAAELRRASVIVGLDQYVDQVAGLLRPGTTVRATGLGHEQERAAAAVAEAVAGRAVALIGSGDAGVYAMGSPALELAGETIDVVGVPGITASLAAAALLGAPLGHDHALISLSDLHTSWEAIERRVTAVAEADLVACFYNPASRERSWQLRKALSILAACRPPGTPVGWVRDASRPGEAVGTSTLAAFDPALVDMRTLVIVGSSRSRMVAGRMVTPRDYRWAPS